DTDCLGVFDVDVVKFRPTRHEDKVPQMGWNTIGDLKSDLFKGLSEEEFVYFVHSFYAPLCADTIATTNYVQPYSSALHRDNFYATQFHPEKSGAVGERIIRNFLEM
ncbi:MAG: imidazole glycerol phosphate synthase subunit HisH, partial [Bacteroidaceae bacterium]|nr:imidazole glycerol phosphate synthase subunit HisH [Bacteroidaceae bacterium]